MPLNPVPIVNASKFVPNALPDIVLLVNLALAIEPANIAFVTDPVSPVVTILPLTSGSVNVRSAVGSVTCSVVSKASSVAPSNIKLLPKFNDVTFKLVPFMVLTYKLFHFLDALPKLYVLVVAGITLVDICVK